MEEGRDPLTALGIKLQKKRWHPQAEKYPPMRVWQRK
jgi:hypothetical protein